MVHEQIIPPDNVDKDQIIDQLEIFDFLFFFRLNVFHQRYSPDHDILQIKSYNTIFSI